MVRLDNSVNLVVLLGDLHRRPRVFDAEDFGIPRTVLELRMRHGDHHDLVTVGWYGPPGEVDFAEGEPLIVYGNVRRTWFSGVRNFLDVEAIEIFPASARDRAHDLVAVVADVLQVLH